MKLTTTSPVLGRAYSAMLITAFHASRKTIVKHVSQDTTRQMGPVCSVLCRIVCFAMTKINVNSVKQNTVFKSLENVFYAM